jgi:CRP-like cAMP-binding protein
MSFFHKSPAMASVICESDSCSYWKITRKDFEKFLEKNPEVKTQIAETLAKREKENKEKL